ncbi:MAG: hypothetical protein ACLP7J_20730 [Streptosporangiaceae bacterium]
MPENPTRTSKAAEVVTRLQLLASELQAKGWPSRLEEAGTRPVLYAKNPVPGAGVLSEHIVARTDESGTWAYYWPWGEPIAASARDAASIIVRVLRPADVS